MKCINVIKEQLPGPGVPKLFHGKTLKNSISLLATLLCRPKGQCYKLCKETSTFQNVFCKLY